MLGAHLAFAYFIGTYLRFVGPYASAGAKRKQNSWVDCDDHPISRDRTLASGFVSRHAWHFTTEAPFVKIKVTANNIITNTKALTNTFPTGQPSQVPPYICPLFTVRRQDSLRKHLYYVKHVNSITREDK